MRLLKKKRLNRRLWILQVVFIVLFLLLLQRLWDLQVINGKSYADGYELEISRKVTDPNTRERMVNI